MSFISSGDKYGILGNVSGADFNTQRYPFFDPFPSSCTAYIPVVNLHFKLAVMIFFFFQFIGQAFGKGHYIHFIPNLSDNGH